MIIVRGNLLPALVLKRPPPPQPSVLLIDEDGTQLVDEDGTPLFAE
jgi:hypothetical protein